MRPWWAGEEAALVNDQLANSVCSTGWVARGNDVLFSAKAHTFIPAAGKAAAQLEDFRHSEATGGLPGAETTNNTSTPRMEKKGIV